MGRFFLPICGFQSGSGEMWHQNQIDLEFLVRDAMSGKNDWEVKGFLLLSFFGDHSLSDDGNNLCFLLLLNPFGLVEKERKFINSGLQRLNFF